jgi:AraC-like DNA-binding protein
VLCATVQFGGNGTNNPLGNSLPPLVAVELARLHEASFLLSLIQQEAFDARSGAQAAIDCLCELLIIRLLRHCLDEGLTTGGTLAGLSDPRLARAIAAIHREPTRAWALADMAAEAGMSRARFAARFRQVTGQTPGHCLAGWRIAVAQGLLKSGRPMKQVCLQAGYASSSAFTRAFIRQVGLSPARWRKTCNQPAAANE